MYQVIIEMSGDKKTHSFNIDDQLLESYLEAFENQKVWRHPANSYMLFLNKNQVARMDISKRLDVESEKS